MNQEDALVVMKKDAAAVIKAIADLTIQKKKIEEQEKGMRAQLIKAMEQYGVKKFESDSVTFTYTAPMVRNSIDSAKLKKELPDVAAKYTKTSNVSASVKIEVRG
jgi:predicted phage-related endonuclease